MSQISTFENADWFASRAYGMHRQSTVLVYSVNVVRMAKNEMMRRVMLPWLYQLFTGPPILLTNAYASYGRHTLDFVLQSLSPSTTQANTGAEFE